MMIIDAPTHDKCVGEQTTLKQTFSPLGDATLLANEYLSIVMSITCKFLNTAAYSIIGDKINRLMLNCMCSGA